MFKKNLILFLILGIIFQTVGIGLLYPKKTSAVVGSYVPIYIIGSSPAQEATTKATHISAETVVKKVVEAGLKVLLETARKKLLDYLVDSIIKWIQGEDDEPAFITDWKDFLKDVADDAIGEFINSTDFSFLCSNFRYQIELDLAEPDSDLTASCTLTDVIDNVEDFYDDFTNGGWLAYNTQLYPINNYYGSYMLAYESEYLAVLNASAAAEKETQNSQGFSNTKRCEVEYVDEKTGKSECLDWQITTPGGVIADRVQDALNVDLGVIINAQEVETYLAAILDAAVNRLIRAGADGLLGIDTDDATDDYDDLGYEAPEVKYSCDADTYACVLDTDSGTYDTKADCEVECIEDEEGGLEMPTCDMCGGVYVRGRKGGGDSCSGDGTCSLCTGFQPVEACVAFCINGKSNMWEDNGTAFTKQEIIDAGYQEMFDYFGFTIPDDGCTCDRSMYSAKGTFGEGYTNDSSYCRGCIMLPNGMSACTVSDWCDNNCYSE